MDIIWCLSGIEILSFTPVTTSNLRKRLPLPSRKSLVTDINGFNAKRLLQPI
jgi:hypothetical protein